MNIEYLGTDYGGWFVDLDLIKEGDTIIDAGLGEDVSFLQEMLRKKNIRIIGIDPTKKSHDYIDKNPVENMILMKMAIAKKGEREVEIFKNSNPDHVSESSFKDHLSTLGMESYKVRSVCFKDLIEKYSPSLIKMDIEGTEYEVLKECIGIKQICVEFHHHCIPSKTKKDTEDLINFMINKGYKVISINHEREYTLVLEE